MAVGRLFNASCRWPFLFASGVHHAPWAKQGHETAQDRLEV